MTATNRYKSIRGSNGIDRMIPSREIRGEAPSPWSAPGRGWRLGGFGWMAILLVTFGVVARISFPDIPNFAPISAIAMFAGFYFRSGGASGLVWAAAIPLAIMVISDTFLSGYEPALRAVVYVSLAAPVLLRGFVTRAMNRILDGNGLRCVGAAGRLFACASAASCFFYLTTNLATWGFSHWYTKDWSGLLECLLAGIPFLRYTLAGDLSFSVLLFGGYALARKILAGPATYRGVIASASSAGR